MLAFLLRNRRLRGAGVVAAGLLLNAAVIGLNGAMPVERGAAQAAGVPYGAIAAGRDARHEPAGPATRLRPLGDVVPVPLPLLPQVLSPGDVLVAAGLGVVVLVAAGPVPTRPVPRLPPPGRGTLEAGTAVRPTTPARGETMAKKGRKRRARKKNAANHGKRPNA